MEKIRLGKTGMMVSRIGFGGIPIQRIYEDEAIATVRRSLALGINYIDTAYAYGTSEERIGKAIGGQRQWVILATKTAPVRTDINTHLEHSLGSLQVASIDLYQFHNVSDFKTLEDILAPGGQLDIVKEARKAGVVKHIGISSHQIDVAIEAVKSEQFETIMYPFNFVMREAEDNLIPLARKLDVGFIAMKPFAGGRIKQIALAIKYLLQFPDILILPGIGRIQEAEEIVKVMDNPGLTGAEKQEIERLTEVYSRRFCRHCDFCMPCPKGIAISFVLDWEPLSTSFPIENMYTGHMAAMMEQVTQCDRCGICESKCPYHLPIVQLINEYYRQYETGKKGLLSRKSDTTT